MIVFLNKFAVSKIGVAFFLAAIACESKPTSAATLTNGNFETGLAGWTVLNQSGSNGSWFQQTGTLSPESDFAVPSPPLGSFAAMTDQFGPGSHVLYQDIFLESNSLHTLSLQTFLGNRGNAFVTPNSMSFTITQNQQFRIDIVPTSFDNFFSGTASGGVLTNVFQTSVGSELVFTDYQNLTSDLSPFAGQTVRLAFREVDNQGGFQVGVDNINISSRPVPEPSQTLGSIVFSGFALLFYRYKRHKKKKINLSN